MSKEAVFTLKLEPELRASFMAETEATHRPASQVMRELMREFVQRQQDAREYDDFLRQKVDLARSSMRAGSGSSNDEIEAKFAARRAATASRVCESSGHLRRCKIAKTSETTSQQTTLVRLWSKVRT
jgi:hypothetical protein